MLSDQVHALLDAAADRQHLTEYITQLESLGFEAASRDGVLAWVGPTPTCLIADGHTTATECAIIFRPAWPYLPPLLHVDGIETWHANQELLCLWRDGDASRQWATVAGLMERVDTWSEQATRDFGDDPETLNALVYWNGPRSGHAGLVDVHDLAARSVKGTGDGHAGRLYFRPATDDPTARGEILHLTATTLGKQDIPRGFGDPRQLRGRYFYREQGRLTSPPTTVTQWLDALTEEQRASFDRDRNDRRHVRLIHILLWETGGGPAAIALESRRDETGGWSTATLDLHPDGERALLLRAGPDAEVLRPARIVLVGAGAIGGYVADLLARSGVGHIDIVDHDALWPANGTRHVAGQGTVGSKAHIVAGLVTANCPWTTATPHPTALWHPESIAQLVEGRDLVIDATADKGHVELTARVCRDLGVPIVAASLHRGGAVLRVMRQAEGDTPIWERAHLDGYPTIPALPDELEYAGLETGCLAPVHNAPPAAVMRAAALTTEVAVDHLSGRRTEPDEVIDVIRSSGGWLDVPGRLATTARPINVHVTEAARTAMLAAAAALGSNETGGLLAGPLDGDRPIITDAVEIPAATPSPTSYLPGIDAITAALANVRDGDPRKGYIGLWHSHPHAAEPSTTDLASFAAIADDPSTGDPVFLIVAGADDGPVLTAHRHPQHGPVQLHRAGNLEDLT